MKSQTIRINNQHAKSHAIDMLSQLPVDKHIELVFRKQKRNNDQNAKLHAMISNLAQDFGYTPLEMKFIIKDELGLFHDLPGKTKTIRVYHETSAMSITELRDVIEMLYNWAAGHGVVLE